MDGWSRSFKNCSYIDVEVKLFDECEERLKTLFDKALLIFLEEEGNSSISISSGSSSRPLPAVLGDGETVDLFKLFVLVREREGFDSVSRKGLWDSVAEQLGLDCSVSPSLRLVYSKYLDRMEKWAVEKSRVVNWDTKESRKKGCFGGLLHELGDGFRSLLEKGECGNKRMVLECNHVQESGTESHRPKKRFKTNSHDDDDDDDEETETDLSCVDLSDDDSVSDEEEEEEDFSSENQETLPGMLKWLYLVAARPHDPSIGVVPHCSKWKEYTDRNQSWIQVIQAKNALLVQRDNTEVRYQNSQLPGHQTIHPSMYDDDRRSTGRLRYSIRRPHVSKPDSSSYCNGSSVSLTKPSSSNCRELITTPPRLDVIAVASTEPNKPEFPRRYVCVGRSFQARVDEWTGTGLDSDTKWLGTCIWPLGNEEEGLDRTLVGKGRPDCCSCDMNRSGSVECVRFHIAEKRMELKRDLGEVFFRWRFNQMGEEVSLRWTEREEKRFKEMMISDPECFWENAVKGFRGKKREQVVSYYFNVFLINRRRYQNRVTPWEVDSDDEEAFGCVGNGFGRHAVASFDSDVMICSQNSQCIDLD